MRLAVASRALANAVLRPLNARGGAPLRGCRATVASLPRAAWRTFGSSSSSDEAPQEYFFMDLELEGTVLVRRTIIWLPYAPGMPPGEASIRAHAANLLSPAGEYGQQDATLQLRGNRFLADDQLATCSFAQGVLLPSVAEILASFTAGGGPADKGDKGGAVPWKNTMSCEGRVVVPVDHDGVARGEISVELGTGLTEHRPRHVVGAVIDGMDILKKLAADACGESAQAVKVLNSGPMPKNKGIRAGEQSEGTSGRVAGGKHNYTLYE